MKNNSKKRGRTSSAQLRLKKPRKFEKSVLRKELLWYVFFNGYFQKLSCILTRDSWQSLVTGKLPAKSLLAGFSPKFRGTDFSTVILCEIGMLDTLSSYWNVSDIPLFQESKKGGFSPTLGEANGKGNQAKRKRDTWRARLFQAFWIAK